MSTEIIIAVIAGITSVLSAVSGVLVSARLTNFRLERLEERVKIHNSVVERVARLEFLSGYRSAYGEGTEKL